MHRGAGVTFSGAVHMVEEVWPAANGNLRLILSEQTAVQGRDLLALSGGPLYSAAGASEADVKFRSGSLSILSHKKVTAEGVNDNFHAILVMVFDPSTLTIDLGLKGAYDGGQP